MEWRAAVFGFADRVTDFFGACAPKEPAMNDAAGFAKFASEWQRRRGHRHVAPRAAADQGRSVGFRESVARSGGRGC